MTNKLTVLEDRVYKYLGKRWKRCVRFIIFSLLIILLSRVPYVNLVSSQTVVITIIVGLFFLLVIKNVKVELFFTLFLLFVSMVLLVFRFSERAELFSSWVYVMLMVMTLEVIFK